MFSQDLFDDYYMEKPQWDRLTLGSTFNYQSQNYFGEGYTQQKVVNLFEYLIFMNFKGFSSFEKYRDQNQRTQLFNQEDSTFVFGFF